MSNDKIIEELDDILEKDYDDRTIMRDDIVCLIEKAREEGKSNAMELLIEAMKNVSNGREDITSEFIVSVLSEIKDEVQKIKAACNSALAENNNNRLTSNFIVGQLRQQLKQKDAEHQTQVRNLENRIEEQLKALENNLTGTKSDKYLKGAIDAYNDLKVILPSIFPSPKPTASGVLKDGVDKK